MIAASKHYQVSETEEKVYMVMEYAGGGELMDHTCVTNGLQWEE